MIKNIKFGIIGCGNMASAIVKALVTKKFVAAGNIFISDKVTKKRASLARACNVRECQSNEGLVRKCDAILLAVKPQDSRTVLDEVQGAFNKNKICISIMAGVKIKDLERKISSEIPIVRVMPNLAAIVQESISCICYNDFAGKKVKEIVEGIFNCIGNVIEVNEDKLDTVTAISGSGPAYFFYLVEALKEAGIELGLSDKEAHTLAVRTLIGSAAIMESINESPRVLRKRVTSKGGTTEAAFRILETRRFKEIVKDAIKAAKEKAEELSSGG